MERGRGMGRGTVTNESGWQLPADLLSRRSGYCLGLGIIFRKEQRDSSESSRRFCGFEQPFVRRQRTQSRRFAFLLDYPLHRTAVEARTEVLCSVHITCSDRFADSSVYSAVRVFLAVVKMKRCEQIFSRFDLGSAIVTHMDPPATVAPVELLFEFNQ